MDHKVSKDMISSGMIPSGEKTQADLGRIQYGSVPSPNSLMDAYKSIYEHHQKDENGNTIPHEDEDIKEENLDEMNAGYSTDPGLATTKNAQVNTTTRQGKPRSKAQMMAARRIASGKSIADVKSANVQSMRDKARARNAAFQAKRAERRKPMGMTQGKPMPSNFAGGVSGKGKATDDFSSQYKSTAGTRNINKPKPMMGHSAAKRRRAGLMNDVDLFDLIKGAFIEEGYNESDALAFMVEANQEYLAELDRELTMLGVAGAAAVPAIAKRLFGKKVEKKIDTERKTNKIGGDRRSGVGMKESAGVFADPKLNKKYPDQPKMTEKGKKILPNLPDPQGMGSKKTKKTPRVFGDPTGEMTKDFFK